MDPAAPSSAVLELEKLRRATVNVFPFDNVVVPEFMRKDREKVLLKDYPFIDDSGCFLPSELSCGPHFSELLTELRKPALRQIMEEKFNISLEGKPLHITMRGRCDRQDGRVNTDYAGSRLVTAFLYMNDIWHNHGARLRLLRSRDLTHVGLETPHDGGTLVAFRNSERSFHGHLPFTGTRKVIELAWLENARHGLRAQMTHFLPQFLPGFMQTATLN